ncbi:MAG: hypothetical protein JWO32_831, partial [Bacteroidetes bacterium]|nr:hypothetical protein [Bacteroidota bacterium]
TAVSAQPIAEPQMADTFRQEGKIYVVITVIAMVFTALVIFLVILDRKIKKLEEKFKS